MKANCPHCESPITSLRLSAVVGNVDNRSKWNCLVFACPICNKAISADIDMTAVRADIIDAISSSR